MARDPALSHRILKAVQTAAEQIHRRRVRAWVASDQGPLPTWDQSWELAGQEFTLVWQALGRLATVSPEDIDRAFEICS